MGSLVSKVALITGGASGIGSVIAKRLSADGATVVISDVQSDLGRTVASQNGYVFIEQNVCDELRWTEVVQEIEARFGNLHVLVNNAGFLGSMGQSTPENTTIAEWKKSFAVNVEGTFLGCRAAILAMRRAGYGSIINVSSIGALMATPQATAYGSAKAAVRQFTKSVAQHCVEQGMRIRCNSVHPGIVPTPLWLKYAGEDASARGISTEQVLLESKEMIPMGDFTLPEDVAAAVSFLASEEARHITGSMLIVDGGLINCDSYRFSRR